MNLWKMKETFLKMAFFKMAANAIIKYEKYYISGPRYCLLYTSDAADE